MEAKKMLAAEIVTRFHGEDKAILAEKEFTNIFNGIKNSLPLEEKMSFSKEDVDFVDKQIREEERRVEESRVEYRRGDSLDARKQGDLLATPADEQL